MAESRVTPQGADDRITIEDIRALAGDIDEIDAAAIIATGGTRAELEEAYFYARGDGDLMDRNGRPLVGAVAEIYEILVEKEEEEEPGPMRSPP